MVASEELRFINALIGFCRSSAGLWPTPFVDLEYQVTGVEKDIVVIVGGQGRSAIPEVVLCSARSNHYVLMEAKSRSLAPRQARSYSHINSDDLQSQGFSVAGVQDADALLDIIYFCNGNNFEVLRSRMDGSDHDFPIVVYEDSQFRLGSGSIQLSTMQEKFVRRIDVDASSWPMHWVKCDRASSDGHLAAIVMAPAVMQLRASGEISVQVLCRSAIDFWERRGARDQRQFLKRVLNLVSEASATELSAYIKRRAGKGLVFDLSKPLGGSSLDRLSDAVEAFVMRKQERREYRPGQPPLLDFSDQT